MYQNKSQDPNWFKPAPKLWDIEEVPSYVPRHVIDTRIQRRQREQEAAGPSKNFGSFTKEKTDKTEALKSKTDTPKTEAPTEQVPDYANFYRRAKDHTEDITIDDLVGVCGKGFPPEFRSIYQYNIPDVKSENEPWKVNPAAVPKDIKPIILSVVSSVSLGRRLNLEKLAKKADNVHYNPESGTFTTLLMRLKKPRATGMVFKSGQIVVSGTKSEAECKIATRRFARIIQKSGSYRISVKGFQIQNIAAKVDLGFKVRLHMLAKSPFLTRTPGYHPELFNGLQVDFTTSKGRVVIFQTGAALITGVTSEKEVDEALAFVYPLAKLYAV